MKSYVTAQLHENYNLNEPYNDLPYARPQFIAQLM